MDKFTLENGARIIFDRINTTKSASIGVFIKSGTKYENNYNNGISHFLEHIILRNRNRENIYYTQTFDDLGTQISALTTKEYTCFYTRVIGEHLVEVIPNIYDLIFSLNISFDDFNREKQVIINEINEYDDNGMEYCMLEASKVSFGDHPLSYDILGTRHNVSNFKLDEILDYHQKKYVPHNVIVVISGFITQDVENTVKNIYSRLITTKYAESNLKTPTFHDNRIYRYKDISQSHLCYSFRGISYSSNSDLLYRLFVLIHTLGGNSPSSRLMQKFRNELGIVYNIYCNTRIYKEAGLFFIYLSTASRDINNINHNLKILLEELLSQGISEKELARAKQRYKYEMVFGLENTMDRMFYFGQNEINDLEVKDINKELDHINQIELQDVNSLIENIFSKSNSLAVVSNIDIDVEELTLV